MNDLNETIRSLFGEMVSVKRRTPVSGGDINRAYALDLSDGRRLFMKANSKGNEDFFRAESEGLAAIRRTGTVRVPDEIARGTEDNEAFLLLEYVGSGPGSKRSSEELGTDLARSRHGQNSSQSADWYRSLKERTAASTERNEKLLRHSSGGSADILQSRISRRFFTEICGRETI